MTANEFYASLSGKRITFVGVGRSNLPLIEQFKAHGAAVSVRDKRSEAALGEDGEALKKLGAKLICGEDYLESIDEDMLFRAPGVPYLLPELQKARANGVAVTSEMEVFFDLCPCKIYAVTGSDGKTTTTSVIAEMLKAAGKTVHLGGNIGCPLLPRMWRWWSFRASSSSPCAAARMSRSSRICRRTTSTCTRIWTST